MSDRVPLSQVIDKEPQPVVQQTQPAKNPDPDNKQVNEEKGNDPSVYVGTVSRVDDIGYNRIASLLEVKYDDRKEPHLAERIEFLMEWAKNKTQSNDYNNQYVALKELAKDLGLSYVGKELVKKLYQWIRLDQDKKNIERQMKAEIS